jgi:hypothetical protein
VKRKNKPNPYAKATTGLMKETRSNPNGAQQPSAKGACEGNRRRARGPHTTAKRRRRKEEKKNMSSWIVQNTQEKVD